MKVDKVLPPPSPAAQVRSWLTEVNRNGQLDSGAMIIKDQAKGIKDAGVDLPALEATLDKLIAAKSPADVKKFAGEALKLLPPEPSATPAAPAAK